ncbi:DUF1947 domain-containing protein [Candidatus Bathyarchaeota archaeon]|nr:DUF1947 domain-containing protein [Candidatus Bathyarchaeota archaeon]
MRYANFYHMSHVKRRFSLRGKERKKLLRSFSKIFNVDAEQIFGAKPSIEVAETSEIKIFIINGKPLLMSTIDGELVPTLMFNGLIQLLPKITVDMGAVPHICNGADVMAPGIVKIDGEFKKGDLAIILDERHGKAIAIVRALLDSEIAKSLKRGKVFKNLHYVGDSIWRVMKEIS